MKYDSYTRFLKSQLYKDCIVNEMEGRPLLSHSSKPNANKAIISKSNNVNDSNNLASLNNVNNDIIKYDDEDIPPSTSNANPTLGGNDGANLLSSSPNNELHLNNSNNNISNNNSNQIAAKSSNAVNSNASAAPVNNLNINDNNNDTLNRKEKKRSTILPWTKGNS